MTAMMPAQFGLFSNVCEILIPWMEGLYVEVTYNSSSRMESEHQEAVAFCHCFEEKKRKGTSWREMRSA